MVSQNVSHMGFRSWHDCTSTSSARSPCNFSSSSKYHNLGPSETAYWHCANPNSVLLLLAAPLDVHEMIRSVLTFLLWVSKTLLKYFHQPNSIWIPVLVVLHFVCFSFLLIYAAGFPVTPHSYFHFVRELDFRRIVWRQNTESCDEDVEEVGVWVL